MTLSAIYEPIRGELERVEENLLSLPQSELTPLLEYTLKHRGKRIRPALTLLAAKPFCYEPSCLIFMAMAVELFHTATLVHDDIVDSSAVRRGKPTAHSVWGREKALLLGDFLFARAAELVATTRNLKVINLFAQTLITVSSGELRQSLSPFELRLSPNYYYQWIGAKTASVFSLATQSGAILGQAPEQGVAALEAYGYNLGLAFQIVDDILDIVGKEGELGKPIGSDLLQGHPTLPVILFLERYPHNPLREALEQREDLGEIAKLIAQSPVVEECYTIAQGFASEALKALKGLSPHPARYPLISLVDYAVHRVK